MFPWTSQRGRSAQKKATDKNMSRTYTGFKCLHACVCACVHGDQCSFERRQWLPVWTLMWWYFCPPIPPPNIHNYYILELVGRGKTPFFCKLLTYSQGCNAHTQIWQWCKEMVLKVDRRCMSYITPLPPWICSRRGRDGYLRTDCDTKSLEFVWKSTPDFQCINYCKRKH